MAGEIRGENMTWLVGSEGRELPLFFWEGDYLPILLQLGQQDMAAAPDREGRELPFFPSSAQPSSEGQATKILNNQDPQQKQQLHTCVWRCGC